MDAVTLVLLTVGSVVVLALLAAQIHERRAKLLRAAADDMGFTFMPSDAALAAAFNDLALFRGSQATHAVNVLRGEANGLEVLIFDLHYVTQVANHSQQRHMSILAFQDRQADWPSFSLRPRRFYHRLNTEEVNFEIDEGFKKIYLLQASDTDGVRELFNEDVRHFFMQNTGVAVEGGGQRLVYCNGRLVNPEGLRPFMEEGFRVMNVLQTGGQPS
ncbi:MAG: hypothetical protein HYS12_27570 [Planctomycetes bacterium]|nr:hypothetical protein [Planctomycetota bacterium]